jgi:hypothetical protein
MDLTEDERSRPGAGPVRTGRSIRCRTTPPARQEGQAVAATNQSLRVLDGRFVLERASDVRAAAAVDGLLALVLGPDGGAVLRRDDTAADSWVALWNGDDAHDPEATGMLAAVAAPLAAGGIPIWSVASYDGDIVCVPTDRFDEAVAALRAAGHRVRA